MTIVISRTDVEKLLDIRACIDLMKTAHIAFSRGETVMPLRLVTRLRDKGLHAVMPAWIDAGPVFAVKSIASFPANAARGLPIVNSTILLFDGQTGLTKAVMDGTHLTAVRTAAASALATDLLALPDAHRLTLVGSGVQAESHLAAIAAVRDIESVTVVSRSFLSAQRFVDQQSTRHPAITFRAEISHDDAVRSADLVCTVSSAQEPVFDPNSISPGTHINAVGSHTPQSREIPGETMRDARVIVDQKSSAHRMW